MLFRSFNTTGTDPRKAVPLLAQHGVQASPRDNVPLGQLETLSRDRPILVGFPGHRVMLDSVTTGPTGDKTFHVRDPGGSYGGDTRAMSQAEFAARYNQNAVVIVPNNALA